MGIRDCCTKNSESCSPYWETNSTILRERFPGLLDDLLKSTDEFYGEIPAAEAIKFETTASGASTLTINGLYVHSPRDPERESRRLAEASLTKEIMAPVIVLGFGLGYTAQAIAAMGVQCPVIIVEKNLCLLRKAFELRDMSDLLTREDVAFVPGGSGEGVVTALSHFTKNSSERPTPRIIKNRTLTSIDEQWYSAVENRISAWVMRDGVNSATLKKFGKRWIRNILANAAGIRDLPGISRLAGLAMTHNDPLPVFLAAAGPSLDSIAPLLPEIAKRCILVAVDTSLSFMLKNGIHPDFSLVVDPQFWNSRHLIRCASNHTRLVVESAAYPPVLRLPFRGMFLCGSLFPLGKFIEDRVDPKGDLGTGGSVATAAWDFCRILGAQEIWIAGLDLSFPGFRTHFRGAAFEEKALAESYRMNPAETWLVHALRDGIPFNAPALDGGQVLTDRRLSLYATWFESSFRRFPNIKNYSFQTSGLAISGLEPADSAAILALPQRREEIDRRLDSVYTQIETDFFNREVAQHRRKRYDSAICELRIGLESIQAACKKGETIAVRALQETRRFTHGQAAQEQILVELDAVTQAITSSTVKEIAGFLFPSETQDDTNPSDKNAAFSEYLESSLRLYRSLTEAAGEVRELVKR
ncbi:MAG: DUF115 domain-containing protein [Treponema sp.]|nr:DUF115 domain-containing protein [Treponema sp.]